MAERLSVQEILTRVPGNRIRICLTGGEPLIHDLEELTQELLSRGHPVSLETSGTHPIPSWMLGKVWITISPKFGVLEAALLRASEIKFLVDEDFSESQIADLVKMVRWYTPIFLQPINHEKTLDAGNLKRCFDILSRHPDWRLSFQAHKVWNLR